MKYGKITIGAAALFMAAWVGYTADGTQGEKKVETRVFEMRTY